MASLAPAYRLRFCCRTGRKRGKNERSYTTKLHPVGLAKTAVPNFKIKIIEIPQGQLVNATICGRRCMHGLMVSALDSGSGGSGSSPGRGTALCCWARHFTLIVPLSTQVYKWVPGNLLLGIAP